MIAPAQELPVLPGYADIHALAAEMLAQRQLAGLPCADAPAFAPDASARWETIREAHRRIAPMFWGPRLSIEEACSTISKWLAANMMRGE